MEHEETYLDLMRSTPHWLFEISTSIVEMLVTLIVAAIVWPKFRATAERLHLRFDKAHRITHTTRCAECQHPTGHFTTCHSPEAYGSMEAYMNRPQAALARELTLLAETPHASNCACAGCYGDGVGAILAVRLEAEARAKVDYNHDHRLAADVTQARAALQDAGAEVPTWLSNRVSTADKRVKP